MTSLELVGSATFPRRYSNVITLLSGGWYITHHVATRGLYVFSGLGTEDHAERRLRYQSEKEQPPTFQPETYFRSYPVALSDNKRDRIYRANGVHVSENGLAVVPVHGVIAKRFSDFDISEWGVSSDSLRDTFAEMTSDDRVRHVLLDMDTPGGSVFGIDDASDALYGLSAQKPTETVVNDMAASGGYYMAAQTRLIRTTRTGISGSVGVYAVRVDATKFYEKEGFGVHLIRAGRHKAEGHPALPWTDEEGDRMMREINVYYDLFKDALSRGRGLTRRQASALADGTTEIGQRAVKRGFADGVTSFPRAIEEAEVSLSSEKIFATGGYEGELIASASDVRQETGKIMARFGDRVKSLLHPAHAAMPLVEDEPPEEAEDEAAEDTTDEGRDLSEEDGSSESSRTSPEGEPGGRTRDVEQPAPEDVPPQDGLASTAPAVLHWNGAQGSTSDDGELSEIRAERDALRQERREMLRSRVHAWVYEECRQTVLPAERPAIEAVLLALEESGLEVEYTSLDGEKRRERAASLIGGFIHGIPPRIQFSEFAPSSANDSEELSEVARLQKLISQAMQQKGFKTESEAVQWLKDQGMIE